jgi:hypothetical protein
VNSVKAANIAKPRSMEARLADSDLGPTSSVSRTSGSRIRSSSTIHSVHPAAAAANSPIVPAVPQPHDGPSLIASSRQTSQAASNTAPGRSGRPDARRPPAGASTVTRIRPRAPRAAEIQNTGR